MLSRAFVLLLRLSSLITPAALLVASCEREAPPARGSGKPCESSRDCADDIPCTIDYCIGGRCAPELAHARCPGGRCDPARGGCVTDKPCATSLDCADTNPCTQEERCDESFRQCVFDGLDGDGDDELPEICGGTDCDDDEPRNASEFAEWCDGADNDCNGAVDEGEGSALCGAENASCVEGRCACPAGQGYCPLEDASAFHCIDVQSDHSNCGACGLSCPAATTCMDGQCTCAAGLSLCGTSCVDLSADRRHCGECGAACRSDTDCIDGVCRACGGLGQPCCGGVRCSDDLAECGPSGECVKEACSEPVGALPASLLPRCSAETLACVEACTSSACITDCLEADTINPRSFEGALYDCFDCINYQIRACLAQTSCQPSEAALGCCIEQRCDGTFDSTCETRCAVELDESDRCASSTECIYFLEAKEPRSCFP